MASQQELQVQQKREVEKKQESTIPSRTFSIALLTRGYFHGQVRKLFGPFGGVPFATLLFPAIPLDPPCSLLREKSFQLLMAL